MSFFHSRENSCRFLQCSITTTRPLSNGTIEPVSSLKSMSTVWNRFCNRGQYCIGSNTRVIISPFLPSTGTILNNCTWAFSTILDSTKGQYTYTELNSFLTSATHSETYSPAGNIACLNPNMDCIKGLMMTWQSFFTFISILWLISLKPMFLHVLFHLDGESFWPRNSTHPVTRPNACVVLTPCNSTRK